MKKQMAWAILLAVFMGLLCNYIWLYEILKIKGWYSLNWLYGTMHSVFLVIPLTVGSYVLTIRIFKLIKIKNLLIALLLLSGISYFSFNIAREFLYSFYSRYYLASHFSFISVFFDFIVPTVVFCAGFYFITHWLLIKIKKTTISLFLSPIILSVLFGLLTVSVNPGFGQGMSLIDSIKMGYPIFWLNIFFGLTAIVIFKMGFKN